MMFDVSEATVTIKNLHRMMRWTGITKVTATGPKGRIQELTPDNFLISIAAADLMQQGLDGPLAGSLAASVVEHALEGE